MQCDTCDAWQHAACVHQGLRVDNDGRERRPRTTAKHAVRALLKC
jgi:hypothetical protein